MYDLHRRLLLGCRRLRTYRRQQLGGVRRPVPVGLGLDVMHSVQVLREPYFEAENLGFDEGERFAVDFNEAFARLNNKPSITWLL